MNRQAPPVIGGSLSSLIWPTTPQDFRSKYWQQRYIHHRGTAHRLRRLLRALGSSDLSTLIHKAAPNPILAWLEDSAGRHISTTVLPSSADALYQGGATLYFHLRLDAYLQDWKARLNDQLGVEGIQFSLFASKAGTKTQLHFDANDNFTIQLAGQKIWSLRRNKSVPEPTKNWVPSTEVPGELRYYCAKNLEREVPRTATRVTLAPGSVLYVPRGDWHGTVAKSDSLSLNICVPPLSWAKLITDKLHATLLTEERWRRSATDLRAGGVRGQSAARQLSAMLEELPELSAQLDMADIIHSEHASRSQSKIAISRFVRPRLARWFIVNSDSPKHEEIVTFCAPTERTLTVVLDRDMMRIVRKIERRGYTVFDLQELKDSEVPPVELGRLVDALISIGFLRRAPCD